jgi:Holliday junction resolvase
VSLKSKGINAERELIHRFWNAESWSAIRVAGSGSMKYPSADILAANRARRLSIECKITKENKKYFDKIEIAELEKFSHIFGAEPWIAIKFKGFDWHFVSLRDLAETGKSFYIDTNIIRNKGLLFEELIRE